MQLERWSRRWRAACAATVLFVCILPHSARADCVQSDVEGRWQVYANVSEQKTAHWLTCKLFITKDGFVAEGRCDGPNVQNLQIKFGEIEIADTANCTFTGYFGADDTMSRVHHATLTPEKSVGSGVGGYADGFFTFTMIKTGNP
jgi:hypothetical protein